MMKRDANARSAGSSHMAIARSIAINVLPKAAGFRPIASRAPLPISPIPIPEPITPIIARPLARATRPSTFETTASID